MKGIAPSGTRKIFDLSQGVTGLINLGIGEPDFEVPERVREALKAAVDSGKNKYTPNRGILELREKISKKLKSENNIDADPAREVIVTAGTTQAIFSLMSVLLDEGDEVLIPTPAFSAYWSAARLAGGKPVELKVSEGDGYQLEAKKVEKAFTRRTKLVVLNSPNNPTGAVFSPGEITETCALAAERGIHVVSDEVYEKFVYGGARHFSPASKGDLRRYVVTVNGFSKTFAMTGWRLGYAAADETLVDAMTRYNMYNAVCASSVVQAAGMAALDYPLDFLGPVLKEYEARRRIVCRGLRDMGMSFVEPMGAFYVFPRIGGPGTDSNDFSERFLARFKVATIPGASFGRAGEGHVRLSYSTSKQNLLGALDLLRRFISRYRAES